MKKSSMIKTSLFLFGAGAITLAAGYSGNILIQADVASLGTNATRVLSIAIAIGAGLVFVSALMFIWAGTIKKQQ